LNADGSGTDQIWKDWVTAVATHEKGRIKYWEIWNEPSVQKFWSGTVAQLASMERDASRIIKTIDTGAHIITPAPAGDAAREAQWMNAYMDAGGGAGADIIGYHGYVKFGAPIREKQPEDTVLIARGLKAVMAQHNQGNKPLIDTEGSWGKDDQGNNAMEIAFLARFIIMHASEGIERLYWYKWDSRARNEGAGTLWAPDSGMLPAANAYAQVYRWLVGADMSKPCTKAGPVWTCDLTRGGRPYQIVWDTSQSCDAEVCATRPWTPTGSFKQYDDLFGHVTSVAGAVPIGAQPVFLEPAH
jgi:hypothetical protein